jgi:hypothetical protein
MVAVWLDGLSKGAGTPLFSWGDGVDGTDVSKQFFCKKELLPFLLAVPVVISRYEPPERENWCHGMPQQVVKKFFRTS